MATTGKSSSKRKSSSSSSSSSHKEKKSIKNSSEVKKRRSKSHRRNKSKKLRRSRDASVSYSDEDLRTEDSLSISSSESEDDYRSRKRARSRTRRNDKGSSKKRVRRSSSSSEDSGDSPRRKQKKKQKKKKQKKKKKVSKPSVDRKDSPSRRKKKGMKRKDESEGKKKTLQIKRTNERSRRDKSVDSVSSDWQSCSTYQDESSGRGERGFERSRGRSVGREKGKRSVSKTDIERDRYMYRSRSRSSGSDPSIYRSEERLTSENYSKRLQSVLIDAKASNEAEGRCQSKDENKAEIIQDYDDYPSCRSNDSYDGGRKKDSSYHTHAVSEKKRKVDDLMVEEALTSKNRTTEFTQRSREDAGIQSVNTNPTKDVTESTKMFNKTASSTGEADDLETILRLKALENLKKFRGGLNTNTSALATKNNKSDNVVVQPSNAKADTTKPQIHKEAGEIVASAKDMVVNPMKRVSVPTMQKNPGVNTNMSALGIQKNASDNAVVKQPSTVKADAVKPHIREEAGHIVAASKDMVVQHMKNVSVPTMERNSAPINNSRILNRNYKPCESKAQLNASTHVVMGAGNSLSDVSDQIVSGKTIERNSTNVGVITNKATKNTSTLKQESPHDHSILHQAPISSDSPKVKLLDSNNIVDKNVAETAKAANSCSNAHGAEVIKACESAALEASSHINPVTGEHGSNEPGNVAKGSSQFEQKTMSVMRGGEMVQVSYKVYIPKKPPALARRKLQR